MDIKNSKLGYLEGISSLILNTVLFALKYWAGIVSGSIGIIADSWHTLSDSLTSIIVLIGVKISKKPADSEHPFGHGRAELIASIIISVLLGIIAFNFIRESFSRLQVRQEAYFGTLTIIVTIISIISKEILAQYAFWAGKKIQAKSLIADAWHHRSDALSSIIVLIGIFLSKYFWWIDGALGIIIGLLIFYVTYDILKDSINSLLGEIPDHFFLADLQKIVKNTTNRDIKLHHLHLHQYGQHTELTFHIILPKDMPLIEAHRITDDLERGIREELDIESTIHIEPSQ